MDLNLKQADLDYFDAFYQIKCEEDNIYWSGHDKMPDKESLKKWYKQAITNFDRDFLIAVVENEPVGYLYVDKDLNNSVEISYAVSAKFQGKGLGTKLIMCALEYCKKLSGVKQVKAWIYDRNEGSKLVVERNGFERKGSKKQSFLVLENRNESMSLYTYEIQ